MLSRPPLISLHDENWWTAPGSRCPVPCNTDFRRSVSLGRRDHLVSWAKWKIRPEWISAEQYVEFPDALTVREVLVDGQILVTTLPNQRKVRKGVLDQLYAQRCNEELDIRNIKTTLGLEVLRCLAPRMVEKELWAHLLAYDLIRLLMAQAAFDADVHPRQMSFKHTVQLWAEWTAHRADLSADPDTLFRHCTTHRRQPTRTNRTAGPKTQTQALSLVENAAGPGSRASAQIWTFKVLQA